MIIVSWFYIRALFGFLFGNEYGLPFLCFKSLLKFSFHLPSWSQKDRLVGYKILIKSLAKLVKNNIKVEMNNFNSGDVIIYDTNKISYEARLNFLKKYDVNIEKAEGFFRNDIIGHSGLFNLLLQMVGVICIGFVTGVICLFRKKNRAAIALIPKNYLESIGLYLRLKQKSKSRRTRVYYFSIFNQSANIDAWISRSLNQCMVKIPSEVPLAFNNSILISDTLAICFPYQKEEVDYYKKTILINDIIELGPENIRGRRLDNDLHKKIKSVSFYSSGFWLRRVLSHPDVGMNSVENESQILKWLLKLSSEVDFKLNIYLHPLEKSEQNINRTNKYYQELKNQGFQLEIINLGKSSNEMFSGEEVGIALFSTILFERIFLKCPTLILPLGTESKFPLLNSDLKNICCTNYDELKVKVVQSLEITNEEYLVKNKISQYSRNLKL